MPTRSSVKGSAKLEKFLKMSFNQAIKWGRLPPEERALVQAERQVSCLMLCLLYTERMEGITWWKCEGEHAYYLNLIETAGIERNQHPKLGFILFCI